MLESWPPTKKSKPLPKAPPGISLRTLGTEFITFLIQCENRYYLGKRVETQETEKLQSGRFNSRDNSSMLWVSRAKSIDSFTWLFLASIPDRWVGWVKVLGLTCVWEQKVPTFQISGDPAVGIRDSSSWRPCLILSFPSIQWDRPSLPPPPPPPALLAFVPYFVVFSFLLSKGRSSLFSSSAGNRDRDTRSRIAKPFVVGPAAVRGNICSYVMCSSYVTGSEWHTWKYYSNIHNFSILYSVTTYSRINRL
jgi:hypothetical protein